MLPHPKGEGILKMEKTKQIQEGNTIYYRDEQGWEDPIQIDISSRTNIIYPKKRKCRFDCIYTNNPFFNILINNYLGRKFFFKQKQDIRKILLDEASQKFSEDMIRKFGSLYKYQQDRIKRKYGISFTYGDYQNMISVIAGFKNRWEREFQRGKKKGLWKDYNQRGLYFARKLGFKSRNEYALELAKRNGFKSIREMYFSRHPAQKERQKEIRRKRKKEVRNSSHA